MPADLLSELRAIVGEKHVHAAAADLAPYLEETRRLARVQRSLLFHPPMLRRFRLW